MATRRKGTSTDNEVGRLQGRCDRLEMQQSILRGEIEALRRRIPIPPGPLPSITPSRPCPIDHDALVRRLDAWEATWPSFFARLLIDALRSRKSREMRRGSRSER